jgi:hypothetical protein
MPYFYDLGKPGTFGVLNQILRDFRTDLFKINIVGTVWENLDDWAPYILYKNLFLLLLPLSAIQGHTKGGRGGIAPPPSN